MSKNLALLALVTAAFCSVSVHAANPEAQCHAALEAQSISHLRQ